MFICNSIWCELFLFQAIKAVRTKVAFHVTMAVVNRPASSFLTSHSPQYDLLHCPAKWPCIFQIPFYCSRIIT